MKTLIALVALLANAGCTTVGESINPYREPEVGCRYKDAVPIPQDGLPSPDLTTTPESL